MDMQDKEFDQLFRSKLEDLEIEPSKSVWKGVNEGLGNNNRKKIIPFLSIAASIIVLIAAGVLFIPKKDSVVKLSGKVPIAVIKHSPYATPRVIKQQATIASTATVAPTSEAVNLYHTGNNHTQVMPVKQDIIKKNESPAPVNDQQVFAAMSSSKNDIKQTSMIDSARMLAVIKLPVQNDVKTTAVPDKQTTVIPQIDKIASAPSVKRHGIHGLGDLLNVVVAVVDKRKDKIIEFGDSDGDGATVTAVNLGPIRVKTAN